MSFNIRNANGDKGKINDWNNRKQSQIEIIKKYNPQIIGFQEVFKKQLDYLSKNLPEYKWVGVGRRNGRNRGEFNPIFYKDLDIEESGTFWLSGKPNKPSNTWRGTCYRICTWIKVGGEKPFCFFNTHLEHLRKRPRIKGANLVVKKSKELAKSAPVIITGDFNTQRNTKTYNIFAQEYTDSYFKHINYDDQGNISFHEFTGETRVKSYSKQHCIIDYIWVKDFQVKNAEIIHDAPRKEEKIFPSDHWPIYTDLEF